MDIQIGAGNKYLVQASSTCSRLGSLFAFGGTASRGTLSMLTSGKEQCRGLLSSGPAYTKELHSRGCSETRDVVLCMPDSVKENNKPVKKEGSKTMAELQADFVKLRKRFKALAGSKEALEKQGKALQELCAKQRLEMDALRDDASQSGRLSATVFRLELELKSLKSSQGSAPLQQTQSMLSSAAENTAAQMAALIRKAAAAQEAADSAQQQLSQTQQAHAQHMAGAQAAAELSQQELSHTSQSLAMLRQELATAKQSHADQEVALQQQHADQIAELQQQHFEQLAAVKISFSQTLAVLETELSEARSSLASTNEQHAKSLAEAQQSYDSKLTAADSKHAVMLAASHAELAAAQQQWLDLDQGCKISFAQHRSLHSPHPLQADFSPSVAVTKVSQHWAALPSPQAELLTFKQQSRAAAAASAEAQGITGGGSDCTTLRQNVTALDKQLALAQAETVVHASTSVGRFEVVCTLKAAAHAQGSKHCWTSSDHAEQMQQLMAAAGLKQKQADHIMAVTSDSRSTQLHAVTNASKAEEELASADHYPSDEDDLDDWTEEDNADSDADCAQHTDSTSAVAANSQSTWTIAAGGKDCNSSCCSNGNPQPDPQTMTDASSPSLRSENAGSAVASATASTHARQGSSAGGQISSSAQMPGRRFNAANFAVFPTAEEPDTIDIYSSTHTCGPQAMPATNTGSSCGNSNAAYSSRDPCYQASTVGVTDIVSGFVADMYPDEENDLDDWTCEDDDVSTSGETSSGAVTSDIAVKSSSVAEAKRSSVPNDYPSDEDDLDDWTQNDDDAEME